MLDLSKIQVQLPELPQMNLEELLGDLDLTVSPEGFLPLAESLTEGTQNMRPRIRRRTILRLHNSSDNTLERQKRRKSYEEISVRSSSRAAGCP